ncbi:hypothetical protein QBC32DRAFT_224831 [Pseudoneurospora amorphoporcata]|uniref:Uncharacterized protein n=1 Tax=Pseudoneurospora amorphoporcata TaxID=241081 RepID=A0AAN6SBS5_9PEZI|nr:hypothetical protein QBC32DRAFT_224831 [Pseudoneurospora amorphoporcata]
MRTQVRSSAFRSSHRASVFLVLPPFQSIQFPLKASVYSLSSYQVAWFSPASVFAFDKPLLSTAIGILPSTLSLPAPRSPIMDGSQQGESSHPASNQARNMSGSQQGESSQFDIDQMPITIDGQPVELSQAEWDRLNQNWDNLDFGQLFDNQQGETSQVNVNQTPAISDSQQGSQGPMYHDVDPNHGGMSNITGPTSNIPGPTTSMGMGAADPPTGVDLVDMALYRNGSQQGEPSQFGANEAPVEATSAQAGQEGANDSKAIKILISELRVLMSRCESIQTNLSPTVYNDFYTNYRNLLAHAQKILTQDSAPSPMDKTSIIDACIRIESRFIQLTDRKPVDEVGNPVIGRLPGPPCQLIIERETSAATAQQAVRLNQAFNEPCRGCTAEGIVCERSYIDEACAQCVSRGRECLTDHAPTDIKPQMPTNTGPPPVSGDAVDPVANTRSRMESLFSQHWQVLINILRPNDIWNECDVKVSLVKRSGKPGTIAKTLETTRQWAVRECIQGRLFIWKLSARDYAESFCLNFGRFGHFRHSVARNLLHLDTYWSEKTCAEQRSQVRDTLVSLLSFCNIIAGYICSAQSYVALAYREFLRANPHMISQQFAEI